MTRSPVGTVFEFRLGPRPGCKIKAHPPQTTKPGECLPCSDQWLQQAGIRVLWDDSLSDGDRQQRTRFERRISILLKRIPTQHLQPLKVGGVRLYRGDTSSGGFYQVGSSTVSVNLNLRAKFFVHSLLHELGHLVDFETISADVAAKHERIAWMRVGPWRFKKFWLRDGFRNAYSQTSPEEDFAEDFAAFATERYDKTELLEAAFNARETCPSCGQKRLSVDPDSGAFAACDACDILFEKEGALWVVSERGFLERAKKAMVARQLSNR